MFDYVSDFNQRYIDDVADLLFEIIEQHNEDGLVSHKGLQLLVSEFGNVPNELRANVFEELLTIIDDVGWDIEEFKQQASSIDPEPYYDTYFEVEIDDELFEERM